MRTIWKFGLPLLGNTVLMPKGAKMIHVHEQDGYPCAWAIVDTDRFIVNHQYAIIGTGHDLPELGDYIGSAHCGPYVWHVFDLGE